LVQGKLLRVIQDRVIIPIGATQPKKVNVRFVAATNKELQYEVSEGRFREDLFYRLNVITINLPPLRERPEDVEVLAKHFLRRFSGRMGKTIHSLDPKALATLQTYGWPGNVRELENVMERAVILTSGSSINADVIPLHSGHKEASPDPIPKSPAQMIALEEVERQHIESVLKGSHYNKSRTSEILGISRRTLDRRIADFGLMD
jgi:two-component system response regulator HydG